MNPALAVGIVCIVITIAALRAAVTELRDLWLKLRELQEAQRRFYDRASALENERDQYRTRLDALERRPPVVTVTLQPPAPAPKQGKAVAK